MFSYSVLLWFLYIYCEARPDGAPKSSCSSLTPVHSGIQAQRTSSPYSISVYKNANKIRIKISSPVGEEFIGFILQARSSKDKNKFIDGKFTQKEGVSKAIDCFRGRENTLTQVSPSEKRELVTDWMPSGNINEDVVFHATVAKTFAIFWTDIYSAPVKISRRSNSFSSPSYSEQEDSRSSMYHNCFISQGCFGLPSGCENSQDCEILLSYRHSAAGIHFTLFGDLENSVYMAMGLSNDAEMGDDFVTECFRQDASVRARESWNQGKSNPANKELSRNKYDSSFENGLTSCSWTSKYLAEAPNGRIFNLANKTYYVLLATGPINERNERLGYHSARISSQDPVNFTGFEVISTQGVSDSIKIHGTFMLTGWLGFMSLGILLARYFKEAFESKTLCGVKIWFALHRAFMISAVVFIAVAFIVIFVYKDGWNYGSRNPHAILGCIATAFGLFQPIMAAFRPAADHKKRPVFNWMHFLVGNSSYILAIITIFFAVSLESSGLKQSFYWVFSIFVILHVIFHCLFQVHKWTIGKRKNNEVKMGDMRSARGNNMQNSTSEKNLADNVFRILLLGIYTIFLLVVLLALYALIGVA